MGHRLELTKEPRVDEGDPLDLVDARAGPERGEDDVEAVGSGPFEPGQKLGLALAVEPRGGDVELARAHRLQEGLGERAAEGHRLPDALHVR